MKIAFTTKGAEWDSKMDPRFGRTEYLLVYDDVENAYTKGSMYCILFMKDGNRITHKFPLITLFRVIEDYTEFKRPENQGGLWFLAKRMMIVDEIHKEHLEMFCRQLNHMVNKAENVVSSFENIKFPAIRKAFQKSIKKIND